MTSGLPDLKPAVRVQFANHLSHLHDLPTVEGLSVLDHVPDGARQSFLVEGLSVCVLTFHRHRAIVDDRSRDDKREAPTEVVTLAQQAEPEDVVRRPTQFAQSGQSDGEALVGYSDQQARAVAPPQSATPPRARVKFAIGYRRRQSGAASNQ